MPKHSDKLSRSTRATLVLIWVTACFSLLRVAAAAMGGGFQ